MRYLALIYSNEQSNQNMSPEEGEKVMGAWWKFTSDLQSSGKMLGGEALQSTLTATTVRLQNGSPLVTDGPFAETKEQLGGYYLINATDLDDAIKWVSQMPVMERGGCVEIRPIWELGDAPN
jgi:hypothetical protein